MKSKTVVVNIYATLQAVILFLTTYMGFATNLPQWMVAAIIISNIIASEAINYFMPSGEFIGHGKNWSIGRWIVTIGGSLYTILTANGVVQWIPLNVMAIIIPILLTIIRVWGGATSFQKQAKLAA